MAYPKSSIRPLLILETLEAGPKGERSLLAMGAYSYDIKCPDKIFKEIFWGVLRMTFLNESRSWEPKTQIQAVFSNTLEIVRVNKTDFPFRKWCLEIYSRRPIVTKLIKETVQELCRQLKSKGYSRT